MPGGQQDDLGTVGGFGADAVHLGGEGRACRPQVETRQRIQGLAQGRGIGRDQGRQRIQDARDLLGLGDLRLAPGIAEFHHDERLDEQGLAAARGVVHDALDPRSRLGLDRHDVAPVAQGDDGLLQGAAELGPDERVEAPPQPVVGHADAGPKAAQPGGSRVEQLAQRIETASQRAAQSRQAVEIARQGVQQGPPVVLEVRGEAARRVQRVGDLEELGRVEPSAAHRALNRRPDVVRAADPDPRSLREQRPGLVRLVESPGDDDRIRRRLERLGGAA